MFYNFPLCPVSGGNVAFGKVGPSSTSYEEVNVESSDQFTMVICGSFWGMKPYPVCTRIFVITYTLRKLTWIPKKDGLEKVVPFFNIWPLKEPSYEISLSQSEFNGMLYVIHSQD